VNHLVVEMETI
jgi:hypothetical protein